MEGQENPEGLSRRAFGRLVGVGALAGTLRSVGLGPTGSARAASRTITGVALPQGEVPFFDNLAAVMDDGGATLARLDHLARLYGERVAQPDPADFFFRWLPMPLFYDALRGFTVSVTDRRPLARDLYLMHLVGFYGGVWFAKKLDELNLTAGLVPSIRPQMGPPTEADTAELARYLGEATAAVHTNDSAATLTFCERGLRDGVLHGDSPIQTAAEDLAAGQVAAGRVLEPLIVLYGYNIGYTDNILRPPNRALPANRNGGADPFSPPYNSQVATPLGVFDATFPDFSGPTPEVAPIPADPSGFRPVPYLIGDSRGLSIARRFDARARADAADGYQRVTIGDPTRPEVHLAAMQAAAYNVGNAMWSVPTFLDVKGWDQRSYDQIVGMSVYFVQAVQAAGLTCLAAAALADAAVGRRGAAATALVAPFGASYLVGLLNASGAPPFAGRTSDESLPQFRYA